MVQNLAKSVTPMRIYHNLKYLTSNFCLMTFGSQNLSSHYITVVYIEFIQYTFSSIHLITVVYIEFIRI